MKVKRLESYSPEYPEKNTGKAVRIGVAAAAALLAVTTAACQPQYNGFLVNDTPEPAGQENVCTDSPALDGDVKIDPTAP